MTINVDVTLSTKLNEILYIGHTGDLEVFCVHTVVWNCIKKRITFCVYNIILWTRFVRANIFFANGLWIRYHIDPEFGWMFLSSI